jgi:hypothetical protein
MAVSLELRKRFGSSWVILSVWKTSILQDLSSDAVRSLAPRRGSNFPPYMDFHTSYIVSIGTCDKFITVALVISALSPTFLQAAIIP